MKTSMMPPTVYPGPSMIAVYKVVAAGEWREACLAGAYSGSPDDRRDGFVHLSGAHQLAGTLAKHYRGKTDLVLIAFDAKALGPQLKFEPSRGGELFPHLYGHLPTHLALWQRPLELGTDGVPALHEDWFLC